MIVPIGGRQTSATLVPTLAPGAHLRDGTKDRLVDHAADGDFAVVDGQHPRILHNAGVPISHESPKGHGNFVRIQHGGLSALAHSLLSYGWCCWLVGLSKVTLPSSSSSMDDPKESPRARGLAVKGAAAVENAVHGFIDRGSHRFRRWPGRKRVPSQCNSHLRGVCDQSIPKSFVGSLVVSEEFDLDADERLRAIDGAEKSFHPLVFCWRVAATMGHRVRVRRCSMTWAPLSPLAGGFPSAKAAPERFRLGGIFRLPGFSTLDSPALAAFMPLVGIPGDS